MDISINIWAVLAATVSSFVVGMIWYSPGVFGETWRKLIKMDKKTMEKGPESQAWVLTVIAAVLQAFVLAHVVYMSNAFFDDKTWMIAAITSALWMWAGFQLSMLITHDAFEQRPLKLTMINAGHQFTTLLVMGLIIGAFGMPG